MGLWCRMPHASLAPMKLLPHLTLASLAVVTFALSTAATAQKGLTPKQQYQLWLQQQKQQGTAPQPQAKARRPAAAVPGAAQRAEACAS